MSLFPAYATDVSKDIEDSMSGEEYSVPLALELKLLSSDEEGPAPAREQPCPPHAPPSPPRDFYEDTRRDSANLRVSTLYYPGRPEYHTSSGPLGGRVPGHKKPRRRYWQRALPPPPADPGALPARAVALRAALDAAPRDERLWLRYVEHQREHGARGAELEAARAAAAACDTRRTRAALHRARRAALPPDQLRAALRADLAAAARAPRRRELWARLLEELGAAGAEAGARAALAHTAADPAAHAPLLYAHGCVLRAAGLWERLVLTVELTAALSFPAAAGFPPPAAARDAELGARELAALRSGLPLSAVWARVERLRAQAHWRPAPGARDDPQRAPDPAAAAELLRPAREERAAAALAVALLRLARVPLPGGERAARAAGPEPAAGEPALPECVAALLRTARLLPPQHPARPPDAATARAALAPLLDPPHYFCDADGFLSWVSALWEACCGWLAGWRRLALLCWRLRWLHALARLAAPGEARRLRLEARAAIKRHAPAAPEAYAHFARLEADVAGAGPGARAAAAALRAALRDPARPERALFAARVLAELRPGAARAALCCAALGRELPPDELLERPPPAELLAAARARVQRRCDELEAEHAARAPRGEDEDEDEDEDEVCAALLPGAGEWAAARAALAGPAERARLLAALLAAEPGAGAALQFAEQAACALVRAAGREARAAARRLLPLFPHNPLLALVCSRPRLWEAAAAAPSARAALAEVLPLLLRCPLAADGCPHDAARLASSCARLSRGAGASPLLAALRLEASARAPAHRPLPALLAALDHYPAHKWLYVRGATWCGAEAPALADAMLERELRLHTLLDELHLPADLPSDPPADLPSDPPADLPSDPPADLPSDPPADPPSDPPADVSSDPPSYLPVNPPANRASPDTTQ